MTGKMTVDGTKSIRRGFGSLVLVVAIISILLPAASASPRSSGSDVLDLIANGATNVGFCGGDDWEPEIAADSAGHVYVVLAHFPGDPSSDPASGTAREIYVRASMDGGQTFGQLVPLPRMGYPSVVDCVITVDEETGAIYVSFLAYGKPGMTGAEADVLVSKSVDLGATWTTTKVNGPGCTGCDHPWIVADDDNVYATYA